MSFELNYKYHLQMLYKDYINLYSMSKLADKLLAKLRKLIIICKDNFYYTQKL